MPQRRDPLGLITFVGYSVLAGGNAVGIRFSNRELDPFWGATLRFSVTAALMLMAMKLARQRLPRGRALLGASIYGLLAFGGAFALAFYALVELEAGFGQILLSVVPLLTILLAASQKVESLTVLSLSGALIAVIGVVILSGVTLDGQIPYLSILAALGAAVCFAQHR